MKCVNMDVANILFFIVNFITIYSANIGRSIMLPQSTSLKSEFRSNLNKDCPLIKQIIESDLVNYTINCKQLSINHQQNIENVLQYACFVVQSISSFMCDRNISVTSDLLKIDDVTDVCPFDFSHLDQLGFKFNHYELLKEFIHRNHCLTVCSDLYSIKTQCLVLSKFNNYLKNFIHQFSKPSTQKYSDTLESKLKQEQKVVATKHSNQKTESITTSTKQEQQQQGVKNDPKETTTKEKNETEVNKLLTITKSVIKPETEEEIRKPPSSSTSKKELPFTKVEASDIDINKESNDNFKVIKENEKQSNDELKVNKENEKQSNDKLKVNKENEKQSNDELKVNKENEKQSNDELKVNKENEKQSNDDVNTNIDDISKEYVSKDDFEGFPRGSIHVKSELGQDQTIPREEKEVPEDKISASTSNGKEIYAGDGFFQAEDSHFFFYFIMVSSVIVVAYLAFHNKNKILAYALEGTSGRPSRRRPNPARYRKLETNLEEAILSNTTNAAASSVVY